MQSWVGIKNLVFSSVHKPTKESFKLQESWHFPNTVHPHTFVIGQAFHIINWHLGKSSPIRHLCGLEPWKASLVLSLGFRSLHIIYNETSISFKHENGEGESIFTFLRLFILLLMYVYFQFRIPFTENCIDLNFNNRSGNHVMRGNN